VLPQAFATEAARERFQNEQQNIRPFCLRRVRVEDLGICSAHSRWWRFSLVYPKLGVPIVLEEAASTALEIRLPGLTDGLGGVSRDQAGAHGTAKDVRKEPAPQQKLA
jgi:hypothetical protein